MFGDLFVGNDVGNDGPSTLFEDAEDFFDDLGRDGFEVLGIVADRAAEGALGRICGGGIAFAGGGFGGW
jgi:hypothetical protein